MEIAVVVSSKSFNVANFPIALCALFSSPAVGPVAGQLPAPALGKSLQISISPLKIQLQPNRAVLCRLQFLALASLRLLYKTGPIKSLKSKAEIA